MDAKEVSVRTTSESSRLEALLRQSQEHNEQQTKLQAAYVADCRQQIATIKAYVPTHDQRVSSIGLID
jgi:hypothetical protein